VPVRELVPVPVPAPEPGLQVIQSFFITW